MAVLAPERRASVAVRRGGYVVAVAVNVAVLVLLNIAPGWRDMPVLTADYGRVAALVNLVLLVGVAANLVYLRYDPVWFKALGDLLVIGVGLAGLIRFWQVFPLEFSGSFPWAGASRVVLLVGMVGSGIGCLSQLVILHAEVARS